MSGTVYWHSTQEVAVVNDRIQYTSWMSASGKFLNILSSNIYKMQISFCRWKALSSIILHVPCSFCNKGKDVIHDFHLYQSLKYLHSISDIVLMITMIPLFKKPQSKLLCFVIFKVEIKVGLNSWNEFSQFPVPKDAAIIWLVVIQTWDLTLKPLQILQGFVITCLNIVNCNLYP